MLLETDHHIEAVMSPNPDVAQAAVSLDTAKAVKAYVRLRDFRAAKKKEFEAQDAILKAKQEAIGNALLSFLNASKGDSHGTEHGTFYRQEKIIPTGADWEAFYRWVKEHDAFDFLERRIKATSIKEHMETHDGAIPPGVSVYREYEIRVRRS